MALGQVEAGWRDTAPDPGLRDAGWVWKGWKRRDWLSLCFRIIHVR